jgi:hypothetical protein
MFALFISFNGFKSFCIYTYIYTVVLVTKEAIFADRLTDHITDRSTFFFLTNLSKKKKNYLTFL